MMDAVMSRSTLMPQDSDGPVVTARHVLVVDDEEPIRELCARVLARAGYRVTVAAGGVEAVRLVTDELFDLIVCDLRMPVVSGLEVLEAAKALRPNVAVVLITGFGTQEMTARALQSGADRIVTKPFSPSELIDAVRKSLGDG
jgi:CheY-like chemotaxis protein